MSGDPNAVVVEEATSVSQDLVGALASLLPQVSSSAPPLTEAELGAIVEAPATVLLVARLGTERRLVGALTLAVFRIPTGVRAWIEDVVVDTSVRGHGIGSALVRAAVQRARDAGSRSVDLTSRPSREEANRLYQRLGFVQRQTNVYRFDMEADPPAGS